MEWRYRLKELRGIAFNDHFVIKVPCWQTAVGNLSWELSLSSVAFYKFWLSGQRVGNLLASLFLWLYFWEDTETSITAPPVPFCKRWRWQHVPVQLPHCKNRAINTGNCSGSSEISQTSSFSELSWSLCLWAHCVLGNRCVTGKGIASVHPSAADTTICCSIWGCWNLSSLLHGMLQLKQEPGHKQQEN